MREAFLRELRLSPVNIIPPMLHTGLHQQVALIGRTNGRSLGTFPKSNALQEIGEMDTKVVSFLFLQSSTDKECAFQFRRIRCRTTSSAENALRNHPRIRSRMDISHFLNVAYDFRYKFKLYYKLRIAKLVKKFHVFITGPQRAPDEPIPHHTTFLQFLYYYYYYYYYHHYHHHPINVNLLPSGLFVYDFPTTIVYPYSNSSSAGYSDHHHPFSDHYIKAKKLTNNEFESTV